ncbi:unnamed protein product, partial [Staurois parvus]
IGAVHRELACFQVISSLQYSVVLGYPWLQKHNPTFDWWSAEFLSWSPQCGASCIRCLFGLHHFRCRIFHGPSEGFGDSAVASSQWSSVHSALFGIRQLLSEVYQELLHAGQ